MQTDVDKHVDGEAGSQEGILRPGHMNSTLLNMYGVPPTTTSEAEQACPPSTDAAPAAPPSTAGGTVEEDVPGMPAFAPLHVVAAAAARAMAAEKARMKRAASPAANPRPSKAPTLAHSGSRPEAAAATAAAFAAEDATDMQSADERTKGEPSTSGVAVGKPTKELSGSQKREGKAKTRCASEAGLNQQRCLTENKNPSVLVVALDPAPNLSISSIRGGCMHSC